MTERKQILIVDDDKNWLDTMETILSPDYALTLTTSPTDAQNYLRQTDFALVILDMRLEEVSGLDVLKHLREIRPDLRAIMLTGYPDVDTAVESMKIGALDYVQKGVEDLAEELRSRIKEALEKGTDEELVALIARGESETLEFKESARWDMRKNEKSKVMEKIIVKTVAGFLNAEKGGTLLIGVDDEGEIVGLQHDYRTFSKRKNRDGYENFLIDLLLHACGKESSPLIEIVFHQIEGKEVCQINVKPSPKPVFVKVDGKLDFFLRVGNSTRPFLMNEMYDYAKQRWPTR